MNKIPLQRQLWMNTKHSNILTGFPCVSESHKPNALNAFVWDKGITQPNNIPEDDHEMTDVSDDDKNTSNIRPSSNNSSHNDKPSLSTSGSGRSTSAGNAMEIDEVREDQPKKYNNYVLCIIHFEIDDQ